jgi:hypothetical protein
MYQVIKNAIETNKELMNNSISSIFTKEDVIKLLNQLETSLIDGLVNEPATKETMYSMEEINRSFFNMHIDGACFDIDYDSAEFNVGDRNILTLEDVSVDLDVDILYTNFKKALQAEQEK